MGVFHKSPGQIWRNIYDHAKLAIKVYSYEDTHMHTKAELLIKGTCPQVNYDEIQKSVIDSSALSLEFLYENQSQFFIDFTNAFSATENIKFRTSYRMSLEDGGLLLLESGDSIIQEGA